MNLIDKPRTFKIIILILFILLPLSLYWLGNSHQTMFIFNDEPTKSNKTEFINSIDSITLFVIKEGNINHIKVQKLNSNNWIDISQLDTNTCNPVLSNTAKYVSYLSKENNKDVIVVYPLLADTTSLKPKTINHKILNNTNSDLQIYKGTNIYWSPTDINFGFFIRNIDIDEYYVYIYNRTKDTIIHKDAIGEAYNNRKIFWLTDSVFLITNISNVALEKRDLTKKMKESVN